MLSGLDDLRLLAPSGVVTYSFVPDGTSIGGISSRLDQSLNANGLSTQDWQQQFRRATEVWAAATGIKFVQVPDDGSPLGALSQGGIGFGDIRIGGIGLAGNELALAFLPDKQNGMTLSGDIIFNVNQPFTDIDRTFKFEPDAAVENPNDPGNAFGGRFDFMTVALHETGHSLGLGEIQEADAVMGSVYRRSHRTLSPDDLALLSRSWEVPNAVDPENGDATIVQDEHLAPGGSATLGISIEKQGFYVLGVRAMGGVAISRAGPGGDVPLHPGETLMYLVPGEYRFNLRAIGPGPTDIHLEFWAPAVDDESILPNGVGQSPAISLGFLASTSSPPPPSSEPGVSPMGPAPAAVVTSGATPVPDVIRGSPVGLSLTIRDTPLGYPSSGYNRIAVVGPLVSEGTDALCFNGQGVPAGIVLGTGTGPANPDRMIATAVSVPADLRRANGGMTEESVNREDAAVLASLEWVEQGISAFVVRPMIPDLEDPGLSRATVHAGVTGLAFPYLAFAALLLQYRHRITGLLSRLSVFIPRGEGSRRGLPAKSNRRDEFLRRRGYSR